MAISGTDKRVTRRTVNDKIFEKGKHKRVIIQVGGGKDPDLVRFRLEGSPRWTNGLSITALFWQDLKRTSLKNWEAENSKRKAAGKRLLRRPTSF